MDNSMDADMDNNMNTNKNTNIDVEKLISEIQARPAIWNLRNTDYADKIKRESSWEEITNIFSNEDATAENKKNISSYLT